MKRFPRRRSLAVWLLGLAVLGWGVSGCAKKTDADAARGSAGGPAAAGQGELIDYALENLNRLEEYDSGARLQQSMLHQIVSRLSQWIQVQEPIPGWKPDPLLGTLPSGLAGLPQVADLDKLTFEAADGLALREAIWLRDVAAWARGQQADDLSRARSLFDWTVRNIQLAVAPEPEKPDLQKPAKFALKRVSQMPWETLLFGDGTAQERAWVFMLLCRQQGLDAAWLALEPGEKSAPPGRPWAVGVLIERKIYLFDPALGLPIPAPGGVKRDAAGQLDVLPATLEQAATDAAVLRRMDAGAAHPYPVQSSQLQKVSVLVEGSPACLSQRMRLVEARMAGQQKAVLTVNLSAQAARWKLDARVAGVRLWTLPYAMLAAQSRLTPAEERAREVKLYPFQAGKSGELWGGRMRHLKGSFVGDDGATLLYQKVRPANEDLAAGERQRAAQYFEQGRQHAHGRSDREIQALAQQNARFDLAVFVRAKQDATYWLGLIAFERASYRDAIDYFAQRTLAAFPNGPWTTGAHYNLARSYEASGQRDKALAEYRAGSSPDPGALVRAAWLEKE